MALMLKREHGSYQHGLANETQTGLGRPVASEWRAELEAAFEHEAPRGLVLVPRTLPGIQYVASKVLGEQNPDSYQGEESEEKAAQYARMTIENLRKNGELSRNESESMQTATMHIGLKANWKRSVPRLEMVLFDLESEKYPEGFMFTGERQVISKEVQFNGPGITPASRDVPLFRVILGLFEGPKELISNDLIAAVSGNISHEVPLLGIDITRL